MIEVIFYYLPVLTVIVALLCRSKLFYAANKRYLNYLLLFVAFYYGLFFGLRSFQSGTDTEYYVQSFLSLNSTDLYWEPGFYKYTQLISIFTDSARLYIVSTSMSMCLLIAAASKNLTTKLNFNPLVLFLLLIMSFPFFDLITNGIRQGISIAIIFWGYSLLFLGGRNKFYGYMAILCAPFFHFSALIIAFFLVIYKIINKKQAIIVGILFFLLPACLITFNYIDTILSIIVDFGSDYFFVRKLLISNIFYNEENIGSFSVLNNFGKTITVISLLFPILVFFGSRVVKKIEEKKIYNALFIYLAVLIIYVISANNAFSYRYIYLGSLFGILIVYFCFMDFINFSRYKNSYLIFDALVLSVASIFSTVFVWLTKPAEKFYLFL